MVNDSSLKIVPVDAIIRGLYGFTHNAISIVRKVVRTLVHWVNHRSLFNSKKRRTPGTSNGFYRHLFNITASKKFSSPYLLDEYQFVAAAF